VSEREALGAARLTRCSDRADVLDAPCGYGRHAVPLARRGLRVTGTDRSAAMLARAAEAVRSASGTGPLPRWVRADYRRLPFADGSFDAVLNLFTSFGFHGDTEDGQVLREFYRVLRPGGALLVDVTHRDRLSRSVRASRSDGEFSFDLRTGWLRMVHLDGGRSSESLIRVYTATELVGMLTAAGFGVIQLFGDLDAGPFSWDSRLVVTARR
jgi:ubiquinone/menaquinone biosynthesis C-methylase UbiE